MKSSKRKVNHSQVKDGQREKEGKKGKKEKKEKKKKMIGMTFQLCNLTTKTHLNGAHVVIREHLPNGRIGVDHKGVVFSVKATNLLSLTDKTITYASIREAMQYLSHHTDPTMQEFARKCSENKAQEAMHVAGTYGLDKLRNIHK